MNRRFCTTIVAASLVLLGSGSGTAFAAEESAKETEAKKSTTAEDKAKRALLERCLEASGWNKEIKGVVDLQVNTMLTLAERTAQLSTVSEAEKKKRLRVAKALREVLVDEVDMSSELRGIMLDIFDEHYTTDEIKALLAYYESPTGKKAVELTPKLAEEGSQLGQVLLGPKIDKALNAAIQEVTSEKLLESQTQ